MSTLEPMSQEKLRQSFKKFNRFMLLMWRLGLGAWVNGCPSVESMRRVRVAQPVW